VTNYSKILLRKLQIREDQKLTYGVKVLEVKWMILILMTSRRLRWLMILKMMII